MKLKVCGINDKENMKALADLDIHMIGHIFYEPSSRHVKNEDLLTISFDGGKKVGVFVNASLDYILSKIAAANLQMIQLHGSETPEFCFELRRSTDIELIKAFTISSSEDFDNVEDYSEVVDYFLFDTKGKHPGGNGVQFDWTLLKHYLGTKPFILSGGIGLEDIRSVKGLNHPLLYAIDVNSKFEIEPGLKNIEYLKEFIHDLSH